MKVTDLMRLGALLARLGGAPATGPDGDGLEARGLVGPRGTVYDRYLPRGSRRATVLALHGVLLPGRQDPRLVHFARALARTGVACFVPTLPGLAECRWELTDVDAIDEMADLACRESGGPVGLVGFCYGGGYALVSAARPETADKVGFVLGFGAYHDMGEVFDGYLARRQIDPDNEEDWDNWIYLHVVMAYQQRASGLVPDDLRGRLGDVLHRYCDAMTPGEKRRLFDRELRPLDLLAECQRIRDTEAIAALSPHGKLSAIRAPVSLVHDPNDLIVPPAQSHRIYAELPRLSGRSHSVLVTRLISHTDLRTIFRPWEVVRLFGALEPIVRGA